MDFSEDKNKNNVISEHLEKSLYDYLKALQKANVGAKKKDSLNKGFFYYFCRNRFMTGYSLSNAMKEETFDEASVDHDSLIRLIKAWSAKFTRYSKGSLDALRKIEYDRSHIITYPTLGNQLSVADFAVLTENLTDDELVALLRPGKR